MDTSTVLWHLIMMGRECNRLDPSYQHHIIFACTVCYQLHPITSKVLLFWLIVNMFLPIIINATIIYSWPMLFIIIVSIYNIPIYLKRNLVKDIWNILFICWLFNVPKFWCISSWYKAVVMNESHALVWNLITFEMNLILSITCNNVFTIYNLHIQLL